MERRAPRIRRSGSGPAGVRFIRTALLAAVTVARLAGQNVSPGEFRSVPFEQWLAEPEQKGLRWDIRIAEPQLSSHQRLVSRIDITIDGSELAKRRSEGEFMLLVQITDQQKMSYRDAEKVDLSRLPEAARFKDFVFERRFFVVPGDYQIAVAAYDTSSKKHFFVRRRLHVAALRNDPLPGAWQSVPAVEFLPVAHGTEGWYLPSVESRVRIAAQSARAGRIEVLLNLSPGDESERTTGLRIRNLASLVPSFKVLAQMAHDGSVLNAAVFDLEHQRVVFGQENVVRLNADRLLDAIDGDQPGIIDVKALENRHSSARFFASEVLRRLDPPASPGSVSGPCAVIVLTSAVNFEKGADLRPVEAALPAGSRVFYLRYQPGGMIRTVQAVPSVSGRLTGLRRATDEIYTTMRATGYSVVPDQLAAVLKPLDPQVFDISTPEEFRRALATVLAEIAKM